MNKKGRIGIVLLVIVVIIGLGIGGFFYYDSSQLRKELFNNVYNFEVQESCKNFKTTQESEMCRDTIECYVEKTADKVKYINLRRWVDETKPQFNPYYVLRGHLREEGITESELDEIRSSCALEFSS